MGKQRKNLLKQQQTLLNGYFFSFSLQLCEKLGNTNFDCAAINSRNVTELCIIVETAATTYELADELEEVMEVKRKENINEN